MFSVENTEVEVVKMLLWKKREKQSLISCR